MSVDLTTVCDKCKRYHHLGQYMGGVCSFGYGSSDLEGVYEAGDFILDHLSHDSLRIVKTDDIPDGYTEPSWGHPLKS
jgi:hypothetical protein